MQQNNATKVLNIRNAIYKEVVAALTNLDGSKKYPMVETVPERQVYFKMFETNRNKAQLFADGRKWVTAVGLNYADAELKNLIDELHGNGNFVYFKDFQTRILTDALSAKPQ
jgi:hypothetical protein